VIPRSILLLATLAAAAGAVAGPGRAAATDDIGVFKKWLVGLQQADGTILEAHTAVPFRYRTTNNSKKCEATIRTRVAFSRWVSCFRTDQKLLFEELKKGTLIKAAPANAPQAKALRSIIDARHRGYLPTSDRTWGEGRWVDAYINGDGITFTLLFKLTDVNGEPKINAVLIHEEVENG
jgi:hypothetical protein